MYFSVQYLLKGLRDGHSGMSFIKCKRSDSTKAGVDVVAVGQHLAQCRQVPMDLPEMVRENLIKLKGLELPTLLPLWEDELRELGKEGAVGMSCC